MQKQDLDQFFGEDTAEVYDKRTATFGPMKGQLDFIANWCLSDLPEDARILAVGCGTGAEIVHLAQHHPGWKFVAVEPAAAMMAKCREAIETNGLTGRVVFHEDFLSTLESEQREFDAATCFLVSHFFTDDEERRAFLAEIAERLKPGGLFINAELSTDLTGLRRDQMLTLWLTLIGTIGMDFDRGAYEAMVNLSGPERVEPLLEAAGFSSPIQISQSLMIRAWLSTRA